MSANSDKNRHAMSVAGSFDDGDGIINDAEWTKYQESIGNTWTQEEGWSNDGQPARQEAVERATSYQAPDDIGDYDLTAAGAGSSRGTNRISGADIRNMQDSGNYSDADIISFAEGAMAGGSKYGGKTIAALNKLREGMTSNAAPPAPPAPPPAATPEAPPTSGQTEESRFDPIEYGPVTQIAGGDDDSDSPSFFRTPEESTANRQEALERGGNYIDANQQSNLEVNANYNTPVTTRINGSNNNVENSIDNSMQVNAGSQTMGNTQYSPLDTTRGEFDRPAPIKPTPQKQPEPSTPFKLWEGEGVPDWVTPPSGGDAFTQALEPITNPETGETYMARHGGYSLNEDYFNKPETGPQPEPTPQSSGPKVGDAIANLQAANASGTNQPTRAALDHLRKITGLEPLTDEQWSNELSQHNKTTAFQKYKTDGGELGYDEFIDDQIRAANPMMGQPVQMDANMNPSGRAYGEIDPFAPTEDQLNFGSDIPLIDTSAPQNAQDYKDNYTQEVSSDFRDSLPDFGDFGGETITPNRPTSFIPPREESGTLDQLPAPARQPEPAPQPPKSSVIDSNQQKNAEFNMNYNTPITVGIDGSNNVLKNTIDNSFRYYEGDQRTFNYQGSGNPATDTPVSAATWMGYYDADNSPAASASFVDRYTTMNTDNQKDYKNLTYADEAIANRRNQSNVDLKALEYNLNLSPQLYRDRANVGRFNLLGDLASISPPNWDSPVFSEPDEAFDPDKYLNKSLYK